MLVLQVTVKLKLTTAHDSTPIHNNASAFIISLGYVSQIWDK